MTTSPAKEHLRQSKATWLLEKEVSLVTDFSILQGLCVQCRASYTAMWLFCCWDDLNLQPQLSCEKISLLGPRSSVASACVVPSAPLSHKILCPCV
uniref:Uncharacterized protein n=1 Tax=Pyxicephalus adspersus TaxID=30357 RepID=A0AAV2ZSJ5_PYXAD|nr:TPA: hypothetical protein GDO54_015419 [Pyxicephalus adspersus]